MEIMKLVPTGKDYLWGGTRLREEYGKKIDLTPLAETWECSAHPDGPSYIANGEFKELALVDVLKQHPKYIGTKVEDGKSMPKRTCLFRFIPMMHMHESTKAITVRPRCGTLWTLTKVHI